MTTVGSLAYSIVANTQQFTAGIAASKSELRTLKDAFLASQTVTERYSAAIEHLENLAAKFPEKAEGLRRTIAAMRTEMASGGGLTEGARGAGELDHALGRIDSKLGRLALSEVWTTLKEIPGATVAVDIAFGNWLGAAVGSLSLARDLIKEQKEALNKTADAYQSATEKANAFFEARDRAREKGQLPDTPAGPDSATKAAFEEKGYGQLGYAASNTPLGKMERFWDSLMSYTMEHTIGGKFDTREKAEELGRKEAFDIYQSKQKAEAFKKSQEELEKFDEYLVKSHQEFAEEYYRLELKAAQDAAKVKLDAVNRAIELEGRAYEARERRADQLSESALSPVEKLTGRFNELMDLDKGGFFDLHPGAMTRNLEEIRKGAADIRGTYDVNLGDRENAKLQADANDLLKKIADFVDPRNAPKPEAVVGVVP